MGVSGRRTGLGGITRIDRVLWSIERSRSKVIYRLLDVGRSINYLDLLGTSPSCNQEYGLKEIGIRSSFGGSK